MRQAVDRVEVDEDDFDSRGMSAFGGSGSGSGLDSFDGQGTKSSSSRLPDPQFAQHLNGLFPSLQFPPELARRILTHGSHPAAIHGHNAGLSFMGLFLYFY